MLKNTCKALVQSLNGKKMAPWPLVIKDQHSQPFQLLVRIRSALWNPLESRTCRTLNEWHCDSNMCRLFGMFSWLKYILQNHTLGWKRATNPPMADISMMMCSSSRYGSLCHRAWSTQMMPSVFIFVCIYDLFYYSQQTCSFLILWEWESISICLSAFWFAIK